MKPARRSSKLKNRKVTVIRRSAGRVRKSGATQLKHAPVTSVPLQGVQVSGSWDQHVDRTREAIATLDRLALESESLATRIIVTNAK